MHLAAFLCLLRAKRSTRNEKGGLSSSGTEQIMAASANNGGDGLYSDLKSSLDCLRQVVSEGFVTELDKLRFEFETEIVAVRLSIKDI